MYFLVGLIRTLTVRSTQVGMNRSVIISLDCSVYDYWDGFRKNQLRLFNSSTDFRDRTLSCLLGVLLAAIQTRCTDRMTPKTQEKRVPNTPVWVFI